MQLTLNADFQDNTLDKDALFDQVMSIDGQVFRALEGRKTLRFLRNKKFYYIKQHFGIGWKEIFKNLLQLRLPILGAKTEWKAIKAFQSLGLPTLTVVGYGKRGWNPAKQQSFLMTEELTDVTSLEDYCAPWKTVKPSFPHKQSLIKEVARIARLIHQHGINHRDFYLCHFLLKNDSIGMSKPILYLIDLHRVQIRSKVPLRWRIKDVSGLYFSAMDIGLTQRDIFRFLKYYFDSPLKDILVNEKHFLVEVNRKALALYHKTFFKGDD